MKTVTKNLFKVLFFMMIIMSLLVTSSCEDDDDDDSGVDGMVGTWVLSKAEVFSVDVMSTYGIAANIVVSADNTFSGTFTFPDPTTMAPTITSTQAGIWQRIDESTVAITYGDPLTFQTVTEILSKDGIYYTMTKSILVAGNNMSIKLFLTKQ